MNGEHIIIKQIRCSQCISLFFSFCLSWLLNCHCLDRRLSFGIFMPSATPQEIELFSISDHIPIQDSEFPLKWRTDNNCHHLTLGESKSQVFTNLISQCHQNKMILFLQRLLAFYWLLWNFISDHLIMWTKCFQSLGLLLIANQPGKIDGNSITLACPYEKIFSPSSFGRDGGETLLHKQFKRRSKTIDLGSNKKLLTN